MDASFWHQRWKENNIAFHEGAANPLLVEYFQELSLPKGRRVFLPLCGKTRDLSWLLSRGYRVAGAELSDLAIEQLFTELGVEPMISKDGVLVRYSAINIDIFVGDIFHLSGGELGPVDAIYDRAALVALPREMRSRYARHLTEISKAAPQLLICFEYDQNSMEGPPFSVNEKEVSQYYGDIYDLNIVASTDVPGGLKGKCAAKETVWLLENA